MVGGVLACFAAAGGGHWAFHHPRMPPVPGIFLCAVAIAVGGTGAIVGIIGLFGMLDVVASTAGVPGF